MKLLIVDNHTSLLERIELLCSEHECTVIDARNISETDLAYYDAAILTGGGKYSAMLHQDYFAAELELIRTAPLPIIGICLGFQLIIVAYGGKLIRENKERVMRPKEIELTAAGIALFGDPRHLTVGSAHRWHAKEAPPEFIVLAYSDTGIEAIRCQRKLIIGLQFHPESEIGGETGRKVFKKALTAITTCCRQN